MADLVQKVHPEEVMDWFSETNDDTRKAVRLAVNHFLAKGVWPNMSQKARAFVLLRLEWGMWMANSMMVCPGLSAPSLDVPEEHVLRWFLLNSWECAGMAQAMIGLDIAAQSLQSCLASPGEFEEA